MTCVLEDDAVYTWGCGSHGTLGVNDTSDRLTPIRLEALCRRGVKQVFAGYSMSAALMGEFTF